MGRERLPYMLEGTDLLGVEVGVDLGIFSEYLIKTGVFEKVFSVDPWPREFPGVFLRGEPFVHEKNEETYEEAKGRLSRYPESIILRLTSHEASKLFADSSLDFVFLDGDHTAEGVRLDLESWFDKVKPGGIIGGHDYFDGVMKLGEVKSEFGVKSSVDKFFKDLRVVRLLEESDNVRVLEGCVRWHSWYIIK